VADLNQNVFLPQEDFVDTYLYIALIITSIALVLSVILQSKGAGLGGLTGADMGGVFTARRGIEKTLFYVTIVLSVLFFLLCITTVIIAG
jgi:preprotein translocase subunit SecG